MKIPPACDDLVPRTPEAFLDPMLISAWDEFLVRYPSTGDCLDEIVAVLLASGLLFCRKCDQQNWDEPKGRLLVCLDCKATRSATAGTFFDHMRSYRAWLAAIWLVERGIILSSCAFQKLLNIAHSSARLLLKRVMAAMQEPMQHDSDILAVPTAVFIELFRRRSLETQARRHPKTEEEAFAQEETSVDKAVDPSSSFDEQRSSAEPLSDEQRSILDVLATESLTSNQIASKTGLPIPQISACLSMLEMDGLCVRLPGNQFTTVTTMRNGSIGKRAMEMLSDAAIGAVKIVRQFLEEKFNGVSRKHLETYLIAHWCSARKAGSKRDVLDACLKFGKKTSRDLFAQITPNMVQIRLA